MTVQTTTHLNFDGNARAALELYARVFDGQLVVVTYGDAGIPAEAAKSERVMWGQVEAPNGFRVMAYDVPRPATAALRDGVGTTRHDQGLTLTAEPFFLSVRGETADEIEPMWRGLAADATIVQDFGPAPWSPAYGMLRDAFGVTWMLDVAVAYTP